MVMSAFGCPSLHGMIAIDERCGAIGRRLPSTRSQARLAADSTSDFSTEKRTGASVCILRLLSYQKAYSNRHESLLINSATPMQENQCFVSVPKGGLIGWHGSQCSGLSIGTQHFELVLNVCPPVSIFVRWILSTHFSLDLSLDPLSPSCVSSRPPYTACHWPTSHSYYRPLRICDSSGETPLSRA